MDDLVALVLAAGWGSRLLPATKVVPKELLPLLDRPLIHYTIEEAVASGIGHAIIVTSRGKDAIQDYFDPAPELEQLLADRGERSRLAGIDRIIQACHFTYVRQRERLGIADAVMSARPALGDRAFVLYFPDDVLVADPPVTRQLLDVYHERQATVLAVERIARKDAGRYGVVEVEPLGGRLYRVKGLVEKPSPEEAPSDLGIVGRYVITPGIFAAIEATTPGAGGELQITDALRQLLATEPVYAFAYRGVRYDTGNPVGLLQSAVALALQRQDIGDQVRSALSALLSEREGTLQQE